MGTCENDHRYLQQEEKERKYTFATRTPIVPKDFVVSGSEREEGAQPRI